jgi:hypothetical protein
MLIAHRSRKRQPLEKTPIGPSTRDGVQQATKPPAASSDRLNCRYLARRTVVPAKQSCGSLLPRCAQSIEQIERRSFAARETGADAPVPTSSYLTFVRRNGSRKQRLPRTVRCHAAIAIYLAYGRYDMFYSHMKSDTVALARCTSYAKMAD